MTSVPRKEPSLEEHANNFVCIGHPYNASTFLAKPLERQRGILTIIHKAADLAGSILKQLECLLGEECLRLREQWAIDKGPQSLAYHTCLQEGDIPIEDMQQEVTERLRILKEGYLRWVEIQLIVRGVRASGVTEAIAIIESPLPHANRSDGEVAVS
ncbi:hypothetical protein HY213_01680 [Candidatus Peregrinibacteria bacterium]|nr:hypothetical protein [Candidatus Peregrinibacteria bacterium]